MSFSLKNTGATYQRAIQKCFKAQLNKNVEAEGPIRQTREGESEWEPIKILLE
jgi:hypothetical protein